MKKALHLSYIASLLVFITGCASVPDVENRLQAMQLHSNMYVVRAGETVETIAFRYNLTIAELEALNPGISSNLLAGMRINVRPGTVLSNEVRARASYAPPIQPRLVQEHSRQPIKQSVAVKEVQTAPVVRQPEIVVESAEVIIDEKAHEITEIPATSWSNETVIVENGTFKEEVIPDTLEFEPVKGSRAAMDAELNQYVGEWVWPTQGQIAREFSPEVNGVHGVDIAGVPGQDVRAAMSGTVVYSGRDLLGGGNLIIVKHANDLMTTYSHADKLYVAEDDVVAVGDPIASLGWNEDRESVLRFEVRKDGNPMDPTKFLPIR